MQSSQSDVQSSSIFKAKEQIWNNMKGDEFQKAFELFRDYCGYDDMLAIRLEWFYPHVKPMTEIVSNYDKKVMKHPTTMIYSEYGRGPVRFFAPSFICDVGYLLFQISKKIDISKLDPQDELRIIFLVIQKFTCINADDFQRNTPLYKFYSDNENYFIEQGKSYRSLIEMILTDENKFIPKNTHTNKRDFSQIEILFHTNILTGIDVVKSIRGFPVTQSFNIKTVRNALMHDFYDLIVKTNNRSSLQFEMMLKHEDYTTSLIYFCIVNKLNEEPYYCESKYSNSYCVMMKHLIGLINKSINTPLLLQIINHQRSITSPDNSLHSYIYGLLCNKKVFIKNWELVEKAFLQYFKLDFDHAFKVIILGDYPSYEAIEHLITQHKIKIKNPLWIGKTPIQQAINLAIDSEYQLCSLSSIIKLFVKYDPRCIEVRDNEGNDINFYLNKLMQEKIKLEKVNSPKNVNGTKIFDEMIRLLNREYSLLRVLTFFSTQNNMKSAASVLNQDTLHYIGSLAMRLE